MLKLSLPDEQVMTTDQVKTRENGKYDLQIGYRAPMLIIRKARKTWRSISGRGKCP